MTPASVEASPVTVMLTRFVAYPKPNASMAISSTVLGRESVCKQFIIAKAPVPILLSPDLNVSDLSFPSAPVGLEI